MRTGQKRKRSNNDITSSTTNNNSNNTSSNNNNNRGRQRLQRASKDKVYAERLAAAGNNDNGFNGSNNNNGSGIDNDSINESREDGACASSQSTSQQSNNGSKRSTRSAKSTSNTSNISTNSTSNTAATTRSKRTRSRKGTEKVLSPPPPNWPFTSNSSSGGTTSKGKGGGKKKSTRVSSGDKLSLPPNWPFTEPTTTKSTTKVAAKGGGGGKKKSSSSRDTSSSGSKGSASCTSSTSTGVSTNVVDDKKKKKKKSSQKYKQQPVAPRKQSLKHLREEEQQHEDFGKVEEEEDTMSATRSTRSGRSQSHQREVKSTAVSKSKSVDKECAGHSELVDSDEDNDEVEKKKLPVSMKQPTIDKLSPPTSISFTKSSAVVSTKASATTKSSSAVVSTKSYTKPTTTIDKLSPPTSISKLSAVSKKKTNTKPLSATIDKLSPPTLQNNTKPIAPPKAKATTTDWSCNRCTLLNNNRKKKCTACGTPRYLTVGLDGTFALDESRGGSSSAAAVREETKSCEAAAANADEDEDADKSEESQQSQLSAMIDAPVFTRSRRKEHLSLTQSSPPPAKSAADAKAEAKEDTTNNNEDNDQPEKNDGSQSSSTHIPFQLEQQQQEEQLDQESSEQQPSEFKQWIQKRHEKKREKKAKKRQRRKSLVPVKVVTVRPFVNGEHILLDSNDVSMNVDGEQSQSSEQQEHVLEAVVEISVLCRIEERSNEQLPDGAAASEDKVRGEQSTPQESDSIEKPPKDEEESVYQERPMEDEGSMEQKLPQGSANEEVQPKSEEESSTTETTRPTDDDLIAKLAASTLLNMHGVSAGAPSNEQVSAQQDQVSVTSPCLKESVDDATLPAKSEVDKPSSEEIPEKVIQPQPEEVTDHHNTVNKQLDKDDCAKEVVADVCRHDDTAKLPATTLNEGNNNNFNYDETSQEPNHDEYNNKLKEQECSMSSICDGRQKEEASISNEAPRKKDEDISQQNHQVAFGDLAISTKYPSNSQGVASVDSPFIQMTQQLPDFDYMSQASFGTPMSSMVKTAQSGRRFTEATVPQNSSVKTLLYGPASCTNIPPSQQNEPPLEAKDRLVEEEATKIACIGQMKKDAIHIGNANDKNDSSFQTYQAIEKNASIQEEDRSRVTTSKTSIYDDDPDSSFVETFHGLAPNPELPLEGPSAPALLGFQTVGSGKEITISDEHMAKAAKILDVNQSTKPPPDDSFEPPPTMLGFQTVGSGKTITVSDEHMMKVLDVNQGAPPPNESSKEPPPAMLGFQTVGSGKAITVSDEHMIKAAKILDLQHQEDTSSVVDSADKLEACHEEEQGQQESSHQPWSSLPTFRMAGSKSVIDISEDSINKANKLMACSSNSSNNHEAMDQDEIDMDVGKQVQSSLPGFQIVGSGKSITISDQQIKQAAKLLKSNDKESASMSIPRQNLPTNDDNFNQQSFVKEAEKINPSSSTFPMFKTAGSNSNVAVSDEGLAKANSLLNTNTEGANSNHHHQEEEVPRQTSLSAFPMFKTAGKSNTISISEDGLKKANNLFSEGKSSSQAALAAPLPSSYDTDAFSMSNNASVGFTSVGSGKTIAISDENMSRATKLLSFKTDNREDMGMSKARESSASSSIGPIGFASAGSGAMISISEDHLSKASDLLGDDNNAKMPAFEAAAFKPMFQTAGKKSTISISEESLNKASDIFSEAASNSTSEESRSKSSFMGFSTSGSNAKITVSEESMAKASHLFKPKDSMKEDDSTGLTTSVGFTSAASGKSIETSEENLSKASTLLSDKSINRESMNAFGIQESSNALSSSSSTAVGFASAGSGGLISISEEHLSKASKLLSDGNSNDKAPSYCQLETASMPMPMFQTAGKKSAISISEESLNKASDLFGRNTDSLSNYKDGTTESRPSTTTNQKVRFSLDNTQLKTFQSAESTHEGSVAASSIPSFKGFSFAGSSKSIHVLEDCLANAGALLEDGQRSNVTEFTITPEDKQRHPNKDGAIETCLTEDNRSNEQDSIDMSDTPHFTEGHSVQMNIVTDRKDTPALAAPTLESEEEQARTSSSMSSPPRELNNLHTPLHEMTSVSHDDQQSMMKSKRLFQSTAKERKATSDSSEDCHQSRGIVPDCSSTNYSQVTLGQFAAKHDIATEIGSWDNCIEHGVKEVTMRVTSVNAIKLRFNKDDESPLFLLGQRDVPKCSHIGKSTEISEWLISQGCDETLISTKWIQNHSRFIIWKLAAMERRFPGQLGGQYLTYSHVLSQLKGRYEKELRGAKRPAVRKILNKDCSAGMPIILCVSQILRFKSKMPKKTDEKSSSSTAPPEVIEETRLELTDGWYAVSTLLDGVLTKLAEKGKIQVGSKLMICNAQLVGSEDGVDPLDDSYFSDRRSCPIFLKITANNTRLALWDAKLGFVHPKHTADQGGSILVKSLSDIFPDGGSIPAIDLVICKRYPKMFREQMKDIVTQNITYTHLTEAEEASRQSDYDMNHQRASEKYADTARKECSEEVDEDAPTEWKEMMATNSPEEYFEKLGMAEKEIINDWSQKRQMLMQSMISKSIEDSLKDHSSSERSSSSYVRVLVKAFCHSKYQSDTQSNQLAELTIWRASEEQLHLVKEGSVVRMKDLGVKSDRGGLLQLKANPETQMESLPSEPSQYQLIQSGYEERCPKSLIRITLMSKKLEPSPLAREVDVVAILVKLDKLDDHTSVAYLTDESGFVMKLVRNHGLMNKDPFYLSNGDTSLPTVVAYCNIQVASFDTSDHFATGTWSLSSCKAGRLMQLRREELQAWSTSSIGMEDCRTVLDRINAGIPLCAGPFNRHRVSVGYILGLVGEDAAKTPSDASVNVFIDYGEEMPLIARLSFNLLLKSLQLSHSNNIDASFSRIMGNTLSHADLLDVNLQEVDQYFQNNQTLLRFSLETASCYGDDLSLPVVTGVSSAGADALSRLHLMKLCSK